MPRRTAETDAIWAAFRAATGVVHDHYDVVAFGQGNGMETELAELVVAGRKRATASLYRSFAHGGTPGGDPLPVIGGFVVTVDGAGRPRCIWRSIELRLGRLDSVDDRFAWDEGEGDRSRAWWLDAHRQFFSRQRNAPVDDAAETVFERFTVVWPVASPEEAE